MIKTGSTLINRITGERLTWINTAADTGGASTTLNVVVKPGGLLAVRHLHPRQDETFEVKRGALIYEPNADIKEALRQERVRLTPARAMLLAVLFDLVKNGEFVSEFAAEKIAYFLQRFGGKDVLKLDFQPNFYGSYSGKVKHVLYFLNGSYISGYSSKNKKPFEELGIVMDAEEDVLAYLKTPGHEPYLKIAERTKEFLSGYYSYFSLELLSSVDQIIQTKRVNAPQAIQVELNNWSDRKKTLFSNPKFLEVAVNHLKQNHLVS